jgi:hypothetical protein
MFSDDRCDHCRYQLDVFEKLLPQLDAVRLYVVRLDRDEATADGEARPERRARWPWLASASSVTWGFVDRGAWRSTFGTMLTPSLYVFRDDQLVASFQGETSASALLRVVAGEPLAGAAVGGDGRIEREAGR